MRKAIKYFDRMIQVPGVLQHLSEFSYHRYGGVSLRRLRTIASRAVKYGVNTSMLEWWAKRNNHHVLHEDLKIGRNSAWQQETANGFHHIDVTDTNNPIITIKEKTKFTRQYFKFIRSGSVRIEATTNNEEFDPLAFINTDGRYVVVVKAETGGPFSIKGFPSGVYGIKYTTPTQFDVDLPDVMINAGEIISTNIPSTGVITVYAKSAEEGITQ